MAATATSDAAASVPLEANPPPRVCAPEGHTNVSYSDDGSHFFTSGTDKVVRRFASYDDEQPLEAEEHQDAISAMAVKGTHLITCCEDLAVRLYDAKTLKSDRLLTRFQSPIRAAAFNVTGSLAAVAGDEMVIKLIAFSDTSCRELRGHDGPVRSLAFDPEGDYLASASDDGTVKIWNIKSATVEHAMTVLEETRGGYTESQGLRRISWHPSSKYVAVPVKNTVVMFSREGERIDAFQSDGHERRVSIAAWSPNGDYLASVSIDGEILVWNTDSLESVARFKHTTAVTGLSWNPTGNEIAWSDALGKFSVWRKPVPDVKKLTAPSAGPKEEKGQVEALFSDSEDEGEIGQRKLKKFQKRQVGEEAEAEGTGIESTAIDDFIVEDEHQQQLGAGGVPMVVSDLQPPFQPGSTPAGLRARFLAYNETGFVTSRLNEDEFTHQVYVEFHDMGKQRPIQLVDHFGCTMAAISEQAFAIAAPRREGSGPDSGENASMLRCERIGHWAQDRDWQVLFPEGESVEVIAVGGGETGFVAAATSRRFVHLYSLCGIAKHVFSIPGPVVTMAARDHQLLIVYHGGAFLSGEQNFSYMLLDVDARKTVSTGRLPVTPKADLTWVGFTDHGLPVSADSEEMVRTLTHDWDHSWMPLVDLKTASTKKNATDSYWITNVTTAEVMCVICKGDEDFPTVLPKPVLSTIPLCIPVVSNPATTSHEEKYLRHKLELEQLIRYEGLDELKTADRKLINKFKKNTDLHLLGAISQTVQRHHSGRALEFTMNLSVNSSFETAVKLAVKGKEPLLAERMTMMQKAFEVEARRRYKSLRQGPAPARRVDPTAAYLSPPPETGSPAMASVRTQKVEEPMFSTPTSRSRTSQDPGAMFRTPEAAPPPRATPRAVGEEGEVDRSAKTTPDRPPPKAPGRHAVNPFARKADVATKTRKLERSTSFVDAISGVEAAAMSPSKRKRPNVLDQADEEGSPKTKPPKAKKARSRKDAAA